MRKVLAAILAAISISGMAWGAEPQAVVPLVTNGDLSLTRTDFEAYMERVPEKLREEFRADSERVKKTVDGLWVQRSVGERARKDGLDKDPIVAARIRQAQDAVLVEAYMIQVEKDMKYPELLARAREIYQVRREDFKAEGRVHVEHILVDMKCRTHDAALKRAQEIRAEIVSGRQDFRAYAKQVSDDPSRDKNSGDLGPMLPKDFDEQFRKGIATLKPGEVSEPFETRFGFHVVRLVKREPDRQKTFEEVRDDIIAAEKRKLLDEARAQVVAAVRNDPNNYLHLENVEALTNRPAPGATKPN
jgi:peptidyl-prolyl cis-trans isomerase C